MLENAKNQMLCSNNNIIRELDRKLIQKSKEPDEIFWKAINLQEKVIKTYRDFLKNI